MRQKSKDERMKQAKISLLWIAKKQMMLNTLEDVYPNSINTTNLLRLSKINSKDMMIAVVMLKDLQKKNLIQELSRGVWLRASYTNTEQDNEVKIVETMPTLSSTLQPTVAIITALYCEKLAVDAMIEDKTTYVRYKTEGESQVYTIGCIGEQRVVSTKLSRVGVGQDAMISSGNATTRLLGIFSQIKHVLIVGVGGGVPHYTDFTKHARLGDVVVSMPTEKNKSIYIHCDRLERIETPNKEDEFSFVTRAWVSRENTLQELAERLKKLCSTDVSFTPPWEKHIQQGQAILNGEESKFHRPAARTDRLFREGSKGDVFEIEHPVPNKDVHYKENTTRIYFGPVASGRHVIKSYALRQEFSNMTGASCLSGEYGSILDSLEGNHCKSFLIIQGIADYVAGSTKKDWQPFAALAASAYMKTIIQALPIQG